MDYKKIEKAGGKLIDELPPSRPKSIQVQTGAREMSSKKGLRLSLVQVLAPILIAGVGAASIFFMPDKLPSGSQPSDAQVDRAQAPPQEGVRFAPGTAVGGEPSSSTKSGANPPSETLKKTRPGKASIGHAREVRTQTENKSKSLAASNVNSKDDHGGQISLVSAIVCEGVKDHQPLAEKHDYRTADSRRVYVWMEVLSKSQPFVIKHTYYLNGQKHSEVPLNIKYPRMRTWSYVTIDKPVHSGIWRVDIVRNDSILKTVEFRVNADV